MSPRHTQADDIPETICEGEAGTLRNARSKPPSTKDNSISDSGDGLLDPYDLVGVGFGPSNLSLAIAARELDPTRSCLFIERKPEFSWHPGMMIDGSRMQISYLKDLATMRNPRSAYSFLNYLKQCGRLEHFLNLNELHPSRLEYSGYLRWAADDFADQVRYGTHVEAVSPVAQDDGIAGALFEVRIRDAATGQAETVHARNVVVAPGGVPRIPPGVDASCAVHSGEFLPGFARKLPDTTARQRVLVAGDGQSAGEITLFLLNGYPETEVHLVVSGYAPRPTDNSPFVNEQFYSASAKAFHAREPRRRAQELSALRNANYSVIEGELIDTIYRIAYQDRVRARQRLHIHPYARLVGGEPGADGRGVLTTIEDRLDGTRSNLLCDAVVLATGYDRELDKQIFADVLPHIDRDEAGELVLSDACRVALAPHITAGLYVQGLGEQAFGLGDTLLSLLPFRSAEIFQDVRRHLGPTRQPAATRNRRAPYPPSRHLEHDIEKLYAVMDRYRFATLISARGADDPVVTQLPLILDRQRGAHGVLFGHLDRTNPHARLLDDRPVTILFHGPNSYISPHVYVSDQLPTWNSVTVTVRGRARILDSQERVVEGLCAISRLNEQPGREPLSPHDERIGRLIEFIVGFEIDIDDITGRFKLSQDREDTDRRLAAIALAETARTSQRDFLGYLVGLPLDPPASENTATVRPVRLTPAEPASDHHSEIGGHVSG
ncbi:SidA/IucD/PvdA family monooxygenase [Streptomyces sp. NPDC001795]|uniref:SidA/IucD/PvdA family monooxygenase n=1 Tax=unclassified Streptomyces TaxID=2593676 RepID=UPI00331B716A